MKAHIKASFRKQKKINWKNKPPEMSKLRPIMPEPNTRPPNYGLKRKDSIKIMRLQIGHTKVTHRYIFDKFEPRCQLCADPLTVKHILIECPELDKEDFYDETQTSVKSLLSTKPNMIKVLQYLKHNHIYNAI